jgi:hypothetical protein
MGDLTTLPTAKEWLTLGTATTSDPIVTRLISAASEAVQKRLGYQIASQQYTETRNGNGKMVIPFRVGPVTAVSSLTIDGVAIPARTSPVGTGYVFDEDYLLLAGYCFTKGTGNVVWTCTAGYATTPKDLEQAVLEIIALKFRERERVGSRRRRSPARWCRSSGTSRPTRWP